ncbi:hypothetical protein Y032_0018g3628 [Ancylostoma ceylanicum]|uniref:Uncharacterized protein n=1 Tax=Ancylostoma ceylanicum TaxID=53326 RepID=A0A016V2R2_9BILA|nr:hypothetical protein Y032_0018g3628 [Ancylostoma ceylanicum]
MQDDRQAQLFAHGKTFSKTLRFFAVAKVQVTSIERKDDITIYNLQFLRFYKTRVPVVMARWLVNKYLPLKNDCPVKLDVNEDYVLGCRRVDWCHFVRDYRNLTLDDWKLLGNNEWRD